MDEKHGPVFALVNSPSVARDGLYYNGRLIWQGHQINAAVFAKRLGQPLTLLTVDGQWFSEVKGVFPDELSEVHHW